MKKNVYICVTESPRCTAEINTFVDQLHFNNFKKMRSFLTLKDYEYKNTE